MRPSEAHLEKALGEFNDKVNRLEKEGDVRGLLDAYINRGCVLSMMDSVVSAIDDFNEAAEIIAKLQQEGERVDPGYIVKTYVSRGELQSEGTMKKMLDDYRMAAASLGGLTDGSKYYDRQGIVEMCVNCAGDLIEYNYTEDSEPFTKKGMEMVVGRSDVFSRNAYVKLNNLSGQACMDDMKNEAALKHFDEAVRVAQELDSEGNLGDRMDMVYAYVSRGDVEEFLDMTDRLIDDRETAISILEDMKYRGALDDDELLSNLHGETAQLYMKAGKIKEAEKHLLKQVSYNLSGSTEYLNDNGDL